MHARGCLSPLVSAPHRIRLLKIRNRRFKKYSSLGRADLYEHKIDIENRSYSQMIPVFHWRIVDQSLAVRFRFTPRGIGPPELPDTGAPPRQQPRYPSVRGAYRSTPFDPS
jgi:hypothetical protein